MRPGVGSLCRGAVGGLAAVALLAAMAACGGGGDSVVATIDVAAADDGFSPATGTLDKPGTYVFHYTNKGSRSYALDIEGNGVDTDGDAVEAGQTGDVQVNLSKAGTYAMHSQDDNNDRSHELHG